jgi:hypothetical protein
MKNTKSLTWGIIRYNCLIQVSEWLLFNTKSAIFSYIMMRTSYKLYFDELTDSEPNTLWSSSLMLLAQQRNNKYLIMPQVNDLLLYNNHSLICMRQLYLIIPQVKD